MVTPIERSSKPWWKSKAIWGSAAALFITVLGVVTGETSAATQIAVAVASALGIYGRVTAKSAIK